MEPGAPEWANDEWRHARREMLHSAGRIAFPASATSQVAVAVLAGSVASATVDTVIYPLDTLKTRMQAPAGFRRSGGFVNLFAGVVPTALSAIPGGAVFFGVYEPAKQLIGGDGEPSAAWSRDATAAGLAAAASCGIRAPAAVVTQRMQVGQYHSIVEAMRGIASSGGLGAFFAGLGISAARELPFAFVQFPLYEQLKQLFRKYHRQRGLRATDEEQLSSYEGAACGSISGACAAAATCPFDVVRTRLMLGGGGSAVGVATGLIREGGVAALFVGVGPRVGWMALGGFIFFGVYEKCLVLLSADVSQNAAAPRVELVAAHEEETSEAKVSPRAALLAGGLAGITTDAILYPLDTLKTRVIAGVADAGKMSTWPRVRELYSGLSVALLPTVPAASAFFFVYEKVKERMAHWGFPSSSYVPWITAAGIAEATSCVVRVPFEQLKMRLQASREVSMSKLIEYRGIWGAVRVAYRGLAPTLALDLPFALIQFPAFESLKRTLRKVREWRGAPVSSDREYYSEVAAAGALSGALAGALTTPLDVLRTRHVLATLRASSKWQAPSVIDTLSSIVHAQGLGGLARGIGPRTGYMSLGGILYLGSYSAASRVLHSKSQANVVC